MFGEKPVGVLLLYVCFGFLSQYWNAFVPMVMFACLPFSVLYWLPLVAFFVVLAVGSWKLSGLGSLAVVLVAVFGFVLCCLCVCFVCLRWTIISLLVVSLFFFWRLGFRCFLLHFVLASALLC